MDCCGEVSPGTQTVFGVKVLGGWGSVVVYPADGACSCAQDVRLPISPDLTDDPLTFLKPLCPLQLLCRREDVDAESSIWLAVVAHRQFGGGGGGGGSGGGYGLRGMHIEVILILLILILIAIIVILFEILQALFLRQGSSHLDAGLAGDTDYQEAEGQNQAETHADHKVEAEAFGIG